ncbi:sensor histidine kinase [Thermotalea metallivorans]|uniref:Sensor protein CitS n=1 Tax=Thermotalea metallivorans TaxID=520762 RepID=A0A140KZH8_9FIRM|nr:sensor histidine kinase [Thermotalea metallivorans]KXG73703.1 Sensor protein CitS [Thermotalea metallivorans]
MNESMEFIFSVVDIILLFLFTWKVMDQKDFSFVNASFILGLLSLINIIIYSWLGFTNPIGILMMIVATGALFSLLLREKIWKIYFIVMVGLTGLFVCGLIVSGLILTVMEIEPSTFYHPTIYRIATGVLSKLLFFLFVWKRLDKIRIIAYLDRKRSYQVFLLCIFNIMIVLMAFLFYKYTTIVKGHEKVYAIVIVFCAVSLSILLLETMKKISEQTQKEMLWRRQEEEYKKQVFYMNHMGDMLQSIRMQRHDFRHHIGCLYGLLKLNKVEEAKRYIEKLTDEVIFFDALICIDHPIISSVVNMKLPQAKKEKIKVELDVDLPEKINIDPMDLSVIIGNLMDNAIEACIKDNIENKFINLEMYVKNYNLIIKITNSKSVDVHVESEKIKYNFTTKADAQNHGFGLQSVFQAVKKYHGMMKLEDDRDIFKVSIGIPLQNHEM